MLLNTRIMFPFSFENLIVFLSMQTQSVKVWQHSCQLRLSLIPMLSTSLAHALVWWRESRVVANGRIVLFFEYQKERKFVKMLNIPLIEFGVFVSFSLPPSFYFILFCVWMSFVLNRCWTVEVDEVCCIWEWMSTGIPFLQDGIFKVETSIEFYCTVSVSFLLTFLMNIIIVFDECFLLTWLIWMWSILVSNNAESDFSFIVFKWRSQSLNFYDMSCKSNLCLKHF